MIYTPTDGQESLENNEARSNPPLSQRQRSSDPLSAYHYQPELNQPPQWQQEPQSMPVQNQTASNSASQYQQQMMKNRQNHHVSLPPIYYSNSDLQGPTHQSVQPAQPAQLTKPMEAITPAQSVQPVPPPVPSSSSASHTPQSVPPVLVPPQYIQYQYMQSQAEQRHHGVPHIRSVQGWSQLKPVVIKAPKTRRAKPDGGFMSPLMALTSFLPSTYSICDPSFKYSQEKNPRRVLTEPNEPCSNNGFDNADNDYILYVNDILGSDDNRRYLTLNLLGKGTFGQVVKCQNMATMEVVAVKVIKNKPTFLNQSMMEVSILEYIQQSVDQSDSHNLVRLRDKFTHREHLCLVFDLLSSNLYEVIKKNKFRGLGIKVVRSFATQLLDSLAVLKSAHLIHCDLKPENILLKRPDSLNIKVIDFGSACHERQTVYTYIQSRFYRSPEVILGLPYTSSIDMWSLGCIVAELFLGLPIFPGSSEYNQWCRIVESLGMPPNWMLDMGKHTGNCMVKLGPNQWAVRSIEEQNRLFNTNEKEGKKYFATPDIHETIMSYPFPRNDMTPAEIKEELKERESLSDFVMGLLNFNPFERWTPHQAAMHPFISRQRYVGPYSPHQVQGQKQPVQPTQPVPQLTVPQMGMPPAPSGLSQMPTHLMPVNPQGALQGVPHAMPQGLPQGLPQGIPQGASHGVSQGVAHGVPHGVSHGIPQAVSHGGSQGSSQGSSRAMLQGMPQGVTQGLPQAASQGMSHGVPQGTTQRVPQGVVQGLPRGIPQGTQGITPGIPQGMTQGVAVPQAVAGIPGMPQGMAQTAPQTVPQVVPQVQLHGVPHSVPGVPHGVQYRYGRTIQNNAYPEQTMPPSFTNQPFPGQPMTGQPMTGQPMTGQPMTGQSTTGQPMAVHGQPFPSPSSQAKPTNQPNQPSQSRARVVRGRAATIGQVNNSVPAPIQQAAALVDPNDVIQGHSSPAYFPPTGFYQR